MRALRLHAAGDLRVDDVDTLAGDLGAQQVLVENRLCGVCGTDLHEYSHGPVVTTAEPHPLTGTHLPQVLGHEFAGVVRAVGTDVTGLRPGDRVSIMPVIGCGQCGACRAGRQQSCVRMAAVGLSWPWGGMAEYAVLGQSQVSVLPDGVSDLQGALIEPAAVAVHAVSTAPVRPGDTVLVTGGGPIGQLTVMAAVEAGAARVYLSEPNVHRREWAATIGAAGAIDPSATDVEGELCDLTGGEGVDVTIECAGTQAAMTAAVEVTRNGGTILQTALHVAEATIDLTRLTLRDLRLIGANCYPVTSWPRVIALVASGRLPVERIVTATVPLHRARADGFDALLAPRGKEIKVMVRPT